MNYPLLRYLFGMILLIVAAFLVLPLAVAVIYGESSGIYFLYTMIAAGLLGFLLTRFKPAKRDMYAREGFVFTALAWVVISLIGAAPFTLSGQIPSYLDAVFETVSGFTTTGASILTDVEALDNGMLFWRSFTHWLGGMGILVFMLSLVNMGGQANHLLRAESPGPTVSKMVPNMRKSAAILYGIYIVMTAVEVVLLLIGGMPLFDSLCTAFGTAGTGGFGIKNSSMGYYDSYYLQGVVSVFMALFGALMAVKFSSFAEMPANFWGFLFCGVLWGFSFIIPGMTSSSILMAVGLLTPLIDGIAQLDFTVLVPWGLGMVGVMALFARIVSRLFDTHYSIAYHAVIGIVLASTLIIIPTDFASTAEMVWGIACAILGAVLAYFGSKLQPQEDAEIEAK